VTQPEVLRNLLHAIAQGQIHPEQALQKLRHLDFEPVEAFAKIDHHRALRTGFPEVIWGPGKTVAQIISIMERMRQHTPVVMATRIEPAVAEAIRQALPEAMYYEAARICALVPMHVEVRHPGNLGVLTAGTADLPVAEEAAITAELSGFSVTRLWDVGVAGVHRLLHHRALLDRADVLIVVAGMEGALPSVVAGLRGLSRWWRCPPASVMARVSAALPPCSPCSTPVQRALAWSILTTDLGQRC
jgi:NCAIR mutase (PurE)-related protein